MTPPKRTKNPTNEAAKRQMSVPTPVGRAESMGRGRDESASEAWRVSEVPGRDGSRRGGSGGGTGGFAVALTTGRSGTSPAGGSVTPNNCEHCRHWYVRPSRAGE